MRSFLPVIGLLALAGCSDYNLQGEKPGPAGEPAIEVSPDALSFAEVDVGETSTQSFTITSVGAVTLDVMNVRLETGSVFSITLPDKTIPFELLPGESTDAVVTYTRAGDGESDLAIVESNDGAMPEATVLLNGGGTAPALTLDPDHWDAGGVAVGDIRNGAIDVVSSGSAPVEVDEIAITGAGFTGSWTETLPMILNPGERMTVALSFSPPDTGLFSGLLSVTAPSPVGTVTAPLSGEGAGGPIAVCSVDPSEVTAISESATFFGSDSYDTAGAAITSYDWTLISRPSGSTASMPSGTASSRRFTPDLIGEYVGQLIVTNEYGVRSEPCEATLTATISQDLWVEMFWSASQDDMDLHLVRPGGRVGSSPDDCYYANTNPDWGTRGVTTDNPSLDLDDIPGTGPENINIGTPGETGAYEVWVVDYSGSTSDSPASTDVTVNIYVGGVMVYTDTKSCARECSDMHFADVDWPSGAITAY